jgi:DNA invertase Pin-like site-specific DNA recombinase
MKRGKSTVASSPGRVRCAIYTRKSSEEGLDQSFNSLDAQREACELYVTSQAGEGWQFLPTRYDDGGYSGGSMDRPALQRLLADIGHGKVDVVVVYKVDRLTRSLADFAKIVEILDGSGASFVSVTQAFNTTTSMGRLTLNVLLSFAQFEREVTGERIRDKIAASKQKGMWMGGIPPLGYRAHERSLKIDEAEAATVRHIFARYLELGSVHLLMDDLQTRGICSRQTKKHPSGAPFSRGALYHLLSNRTYVGEIVHKEASYPGKHVAIIEAGTFEQVQMHFARNRHERRERTVTVARAPLTGLLFDSEGNPLTPVCARNGRARLYRYYVSARLQQGGRQNGDEPGLRIPAAVLEGAVLERLRNVLSNVTDLRAARSALVRVTVADDGLSIEFRGDGRTDKAMLGPEEELVRLDEETWRYWSPGSFARCGGKTEIIRGNERRTPKVDRTLVRGLCRAHALVKSARAAPDPLWSELAKKEGAAPSYVRRLSRLAFLAPDIQEAILSGRHPMALNLEKLMRIDLPVSWPEQRVLLGFDVEQSRMTP